MTSVSAFRVLESQADVDLIAALNAVEDATADDGPRFGPKTCRALARIIVSRAHGKPLLELCYLLIVAARTDRRSRYEAFFWSPDRAMPSLYHSRLRQAERAGRLAGGPVALLDDAAQVTTDQEPFRVAYARMPLLAALAEFLLTALGYEVFDERVAGLLAGPPRWRAVADTANALARELNAYLQPRLDSGHAQRRVRTMMDHLASRDTEIVDDEAILSFWLAWSPRNDEAAEGFRTYRGVFRGFVRVSAAIAAAAERVSLQKALPIGGDREKGEVDPADVAEMLETVDGNGEALQALAAPPLDKVKFLTQREIDVLSGLAPVAPSLPVLRHSLLRDQVFGDHQQRITEAIRRRAAWDGSPRDDYQARIAAARELADQVARVSMASLHVLIEARHAGLVDLIVALRPDIDLGSTLPAAAPKLPEGVVAFAPADPVARFLTLLKTDPGELGDGFVELAAAARQAHRRVNRQGFTAETQDDATLAAFSEAGPVLAALNKLAARAADAFERPAQPTWPDRFAADGAMFAEQFHLIYRETDHAER